MTAPPVPVSPDWLALRESADAAARAAGLVDLLDTVLPDGPIVVHDLACGTGSMGRWLAPRLDQLQTWVLHDLDRGLLARAAQDPPRRADGTSVVVATRHDDVARLAAGALDDASLITSSALLDLFTADELDGCVAACLPPACPVLFTLSVVGRVDLTPSAPDDATVAAAFDAHQRRETPRGRLLGPDAVDATVRAFERHGYDVTVAPSPWRLSPADAALTREWLQGWLDAAWEQDPGLAAGGGTYRSRREAEAAAGTLGAVVHHADLLAVPR